MSFVLLLVTSLYVSSCSAQKNLVIVGGSLADDNAQIYGKVIELAVRSGRASGRKSDLQVHVTSGKKVIVPAVSRIQFWNAV